MVDVRPYSSPDLREGTSASHFYSSLPETPTKGSRSLRRPLKVFLVLLSGLLAFRLLVAIMTSTGLISTWDWAELLDQKPRYQVDVWLGVSKKEHGPPRLAAQRSSFPWSPHMLAWQRTAFHFQPEQNWMNDPNGPLYYKEWYHLFYQYNPGGATWGSPIVWGHAISKDLIHWRHLPVAMSADKWYDKNGVWTGSATILPDGSIVMLYTGSTNETVQVQNLAFPADASNPLLVDWVKYSGNPVLVPPPGIDKHDFRDPTTAWLTTEGKWRIIIGSKLNRSGISLVYDTKDFKYFELRGEWLHEVSGTGMWECVDFFPVSESEEIGLDTSAMGSGVKHVVKASFDDDRNDYYSIGTYDDQVAKWVPDNPRMDVGLGLRFDYGKFYASKTFYDPIRKRRVIWGWVPELDSVSTDVQRGWASLQSIPRTVSLDRKTGQNLLLWPVPEIEKLRLKSWEYKDVWVDSGSVVPLQVGGSSQLDIVAEFEINEEVLEKLDESQDEYDCQGSGGVQKRGHLGPFGFLVHADDGFSELTAIYFHVAKGPGGTLKTFFCADSSRSTLGNPVLKPVYGSTVPVLKDEKLTMRILVDHSIIESFAQGGRTCITSRVYPTKAIYDQAKVFLFNNATEARVKASMKIWQMDSAYIHSYPTELLK